MQNLDDSNINLMDTNINQSPVNNEDLDHNPLPDDPEINAAFPGGKRSNRQKQEVPYESQALVDTNNKTTGAHIPNEGLMTEEPHFQTANQKWNKANASGRDLEKVDTQNMNATTRPMTQKEEQKQDFIRKQHDAAGKVAQAENDFYNKSNTN